MGITKIPEKIIITCDGCHCVKGESKKSWAHSGTIHFMCDGLDYQGAPVGPGDNSKCVFCDNCYFIAKEAMREVLEGEKDHP